MDNKNTEGSFENTDDKIEGIVLYLLKKYLIKNELSLREVEPSEECKTDPCIPL
ncbi:hypothetical protein [Legionella saoudiensis]|uniref:hypothetical protein n=1 Tax=Legionella saoudiensis TaxID=1750561 RepID=UPI000A76A8C6|nr:hypothetical protein [Legionella saoudiensis]